MSRLYGWEGIRNEVSLDFNANVPIGRYIKFSGILKDANGNPITINAMSDIIFKVYGGVGATPVIEINGTPLSGGSVTTYSTASSGATQGQWTVQFCSADTSSLTPGAYDAEVVLIDSGNGNSIDEASNGVINLMGTPLGETT